MTAKRSLNHTIHLGLTIFQNRLKSGIDVHGELKSKKIPAENSINHRTEQQTVINQNKDRRAVEATKVKEGENRTDASRQLQKKVQKIN